MKLPVRIHYTSLRRRDEHIHRVLILEINPQGGHPLFHLALGVRLELVMHLVDFDGGGESLSGEVGCCRGSRGEVGCTLREEGGEGCSGGLGA